MKLNKAFILIIICFCLVFSTYARGSDRGPRDYINNNIDFMKKELGLSDDQVKKINDIMFDSFKQIEGKRIDMEKANLEIKEQLLNDNPNLTKIKTSIDKKSGIKADIEFITIKRDLSIKSVLTQEQFMKWKTLRKPKPFMFFNSPFPMMHRRNNPIFNESDE